MTSRQLSLRTSCWQDEVMTDCLTMSARKNETIVMEELNLSTEATKQTRWIFSLLGVWPMLTENATITEKRLSIPIHFFCQSVLYFVIIPASIQLYWREHNIKLQLAYSGALGLATACAIKYLVIIYSRQNIKRCIEQIEADWSEVVEENDRAIMVKNMKMGRKMTTICGSVMYCGSISHQIITPFIPGNMVSIVDNTTKRLLTLPVYNVLINDQITPVYEIMYLIHILTGVIVCTIAMGTCHLTILFITHASGQNQIMMLKLKRLIDARDRDHKNMNRRMTEIINFHRKIIKFSLHVEKSLRTICMIVILEALFLVCLAEYFLMTAWKHNGTISTIIYFILMQAFIGNFFIFCHVGELSKEEFRKTGEAVYMMDWYRLSHENAKALVLIIAITQNPPKITAGGLMELSYNGFISVLKSTAAYYNVLRMTDF